jgi:hypothetical protein
MKNVHIALIERYPYRPIVYFVKPHRRLNGMIIHALPGAELLEMYGKVEVPHEIVRHIYEQGWADAQGATIEALSKSTHRAGVGT